MNKDRSGNGTGKAEAGLEVVTDRLEKVYESRGRGRVPALSATDLQIRPGEFVSVVGPSGCGKSTLLMLVSGLIPATSGEIRIDGVRVSGSHPEIGMVFQQDVLLEWRSVLNNVLLPIEIKKWKRSDYVGRARDLLENVGLEGFEDKYPQELSGGMRQRVSICRALLLDPRLLLMDEPFGALDALTRDQMNYDLQLLWSSVQNTVLFITHSIEEAVFLSDRVVVMSARPGTIDRLVHVELERPRKSEIRTSSSFTEYVREIRQTLESAGVVSDERG